MTPYYEQDGIVIYHGDCREVLPGVGADVIVTDPPYGIGWTRGVNLARGSKADLGIRGDSDTSVRDEALALAGSLPGFVFGSFYAPFPSAVMQVLVWHKPGDAEVVGSTTGFRRDVEPIFIVGTWPLRSVERSSVLRVAGAFRGATAAECAHPHAKPLRLLTLLISYVPDGTVLDPFMGSGTTLRAAKDLGRRAIGIEIEERYCEIAAKRLAQQVLPLAPASPGPGS